MIWHIYDNNTDKVMEKMIIKEQQPQHLRHQQLPQQQQQYTSSISSSEDILMHTDDEEEGDYFAAEDESEVAMSSQKSVATTTTSTSSRKSTSKKGKINANQEQQNSNSQAPLFLNFTSDLCLHQPNSNKKKKTTTLKNQASYKVNGVNILNRKNLDSKTVIERIQKRRENHNHVERRRRDCINNTILELSHIIPNASSPGQKLNKGNVLKLALDHILHLQFENISIKNQLNQILESREPVQSSSNLIGNAPSYLPHNIIPTLRSPLTPPPALYHQITSPIMYNNNQQIMPVNDANTTATTIATATTTFRPLLPAINNNSNNSQPVAVQHPYQASDYHHSPESSFIYNKSHYKSTCRYL